MMRSRDRAVSEQIEIALEAAERGDGTIPIVEAGDPILRQPTVPFDGQVDDDVLLQLLLAMRLTVRSAPGVGLACPQVGIGLRLAVVEDPATVPEDVARVRERELLPFTPLINPEYRDASGELASFYEGCLSVPGYQAVVPRHRKIILSAQDNEGTAYEREVTGWSARIVQHETDHLDGILYLDRAEMRSLATNEQVARWWNQPDAQAAALALGFELPDTPIM
ncbi:peptide deformylase [Brevibacterium sp. 91QC2O2]|uniref:peptide deformylase n=1 Tax=Brevibacterium sp. 91QC2O2 TaxID=2968458 RepID=UPI0027B89B87|nr:peptide deformylase [Brevibacterium sp. 91QC2O2]